MSLPERLRLRRRAGQGKLGPGMATLRICGAELCQGRWRQEAQGECWGCEVSVETRLVLPRGKPGTEDLRERPRARLACRKETPREFREGQPCHWLCVQRGECFHPRDARSRL